MLARRLQLEDLALVAVVLLTPFAGALHGLLPLVGQHDSFLGGLLSLVAAVGAIAAMATRVPGETRFEMDLSAGEPQRIWMIGPFIGAIGFVGGDALDRLGLPGGDALIGVAFLVALGSVLLASRLPVVSRTTRRLLVAPFVLLSAAFFQALATDVIHGLGGPQGLPASLTVEQLPLVLTALGIIAAVAGIFYMMLIFVPRELADPGGSTRGWAVRFAVFLTSLLVALVAGTSLPLLLP